MERNGEDLKEICRLLGDRLYMIHFADCKKSSMHLAPGEGELDLEKYLQAAEEEGYSGYYSLRMRGSRTPYSYEEKPEKCTETAVKWMLDHLTEGKGV